LLDVISNNSSYANCKNFYRWNKEDDFYKLLAKNDTDACAQRLRECHQEMLSTVDCDPIRDLMIRLVDNMLYVNPDKRPTMTEAIRLLKICQLEVKQRQEQRANYRPSESFIQADAQLRRTTAPWLKDKPRGKAIITQAPVPSGESVFASIRQDRIINISAPDVPTDKKSKKPKV